MHEHEAEQAFSDLGARATTDEWSLGRNHRKFKDVMVLEEKISEVESELHDASEEMRKLTVERRRAESGEPRISDTSRVVLDRRTVSGTQSSQGEAGLAGATRQRCSRELGVGLDQRASEGDQGSVSNAVGCGKNRQTCRSASEAERHGGGNGREGHEAQFMCDRQCRKQKKKRFQDFDIASVMVEDNGELYTKTFAQAREKGVEGKRQAVETPGWYEEIVTQIGCWPGRSGLRALDHGDLRGQGDLREEPVERSCGCIELGQRVARCNKMR